MSVLFEKCTLCLMMNPLPLFPVVSSVEVLGIIKEEVQSLLVDQMKRQSETLIEELERMTAELRTKPDDVNDFSQFVFTVKKLFQNKTFTQKRTTSENIEFINVKCS